MTSETARKSSRQFSSSSPDLFSDNENDTKQSHKNISSTLKSDSKLNFAGNANHILTDIPLTAVGNDRFSAFHGFKGLSSSPTSFFQQSWSADDVKDRVAPENTDNNMEQMVREASNLSLKNLDEEENISRQISSEFGKVSKLLELPSSNIHDTGLLGDSPILRGNRRPLRPLIESPVNERINIHIAEADEPLDSGGNERSHEEYVEDDEEDEYEDEYEDDEEDEYEDDEEDEYEHDEEDEYEHDEDGDDDNTVGDDISSEDDDFNDDLDDNDDADLHVSGDEALHGSERDHNSDENAEYDEADEPGLSRRKRRRVAKASEWRQNKRRALRNSGKEYVKHDRNEFDDEQFERARKMGSSCSCKRKCSEKFTENERQCQFDGFWDLGEYDSQCQLLASLVLKVPKARCRTKSATSRRMNTLKWRLKKGTELVQVCKKYFFSTYGIPEKKVRTAVTKSSRSATGAPSPDKRGRHPPGLKISEERLDFIRQHILSLPVVPPHYVRRTGNRRYVEGNLNETRAYKLYRGYAFQHGMKPVSQPVYVNMLEELSISFHQPRNDRCWCTDYNTWTEEEKEIEQETYEKHVERKDRAREEKNNDVELSATDQNVMTVCFDMQAILFCPMLYNKVIYYKRKLANFNLTAYVTNKREGHCYMWDELKGNKGSIEVSSSLKKFILNEVPGTVKTLNLYADNCPGRNKNSIITSMLIYCLFNHPSLQILNLKFLEMEHTYQEADSVHSVINKAAKKENICVPDDWLRVVRQAKQTGKAYNVHEMSQEHFLDFKTYRSQIGLSETAKFTDGSKLKWRDSRFIQLRRNSKRSIYMKVDYDDEFKELRMKRDFPQTRLQQMYESPLEISKKKYDDLKKLCETHIIDAVHHPYYENLPYVNGRTNDEDEEVYDGRGCMPGMVGRRK